tara:strand:+ start:399 stop:578 length:180 start_codon:yes stop_codon:yes gene_type:complete
MIKLTVPIVTKALNDDDLNEDKSVKRASDLLGVSRGTVYKWLKKNGLLLDKQWVIKSDG